MQSTFKNRVSVIFGRSNPFGSSFKSNLLLFFVPIITLSIILIGYISNAFATKQIEENAYTNIMDTAAQTKGYLDNRLLEVFGQLTVLMDDLNTLSISKKMNNEEVDFADYDYIGMQQNLDRIYANYYSMIDSIFIQYNEGKVTFLKTDNLLSKNTFSYTAFSRAHNYERQQYHWLNLQQNPFFTTTNPNDKVVSLFRLMGTEQSDVRAIVAFNFRESFFKNILETPQISKNGYLVLVSDDGIMSFKNIDNKYAMDEKVLEHLRAQKDSGTFTYKRYQGERTKVVYNTLKVNNWKLAAVFPESEILDKVSDAKNISILIIVTITAIVLFFTNLLAQRMTTPITLLAGKLKKVELGNLDEPFDVYTNNEIGILNKGIGNLLVKVRSLLKQVRNEQEEKRKAELAVMQAQINPHFLYNTLHSIKQLIDMKDNQDASNMVSALSQFYRTSISKGEEIITVGQEIELIHNYLLIQGMRYGDSFTYDFQIDPEIVPYRMPKLILQPLVENAIYHGAKQKRGLSLIQLKGYRIGSDIYLDVYDNGHGIEPQQLIEIKKQMRLGHQTEGTPKVYGLRNVHARLQIHYGEAYGLDIISKSGQGTLMRVKIPGQTVDHRGEPDV